MPVFAQAGIPEDFIHVAENGQEAIEHLMRIQSCPPRPLVMILDVRMPCMDGETCAIEVQKLVDSRQVTRLPYVTILTSGVATCTTAEGDHEPVKMTLPKPLDQARLARILNALPPGPVMAASQAPKAPYDPGEIYIVVAMEDPTCSMAMVATLCLLSVSDDLVCQADSRDEFTEQIQNAKAHDGPVLIFLGCAAWVGEVPGNKSYLAWVPAVEPCPAANKFDIVLNEGNEFQQTQLEEILVACHKKWSR
eukprot:TRINITY_DN5139_c0_g2_i1.p1 TRINITY_DN5139_c0_g2~~TRINITY_DN5139_c0_g2_i1.p1  ORF type:complete len:291 (+),score=65.84 TRINITY_DN5139_c0_g2_i1:125-874(+)